MPMTSDLDWTRFHRAFGDDPGVLPDGEVLGSAEHDWDEVFAMLHRSGWRVTASDGHSPLPPSRHGLAEFESFAVRPVDGVRANFFPGPDAMIFDVDLRELIPHWRAMDHMTGTSRVCRTARRRGQSLATVPRSLTED